jgi:hypothetical protein
MLKRPALAILLLLLSAGISLACKPPDPITGFTIQSVAQSSLSVTFDVPTRGKVAVRLSPAPASWGDAKEIVCVSSPCAIDGIETAVAYDMRAIPFVVTQTQGTIYGNPTESIAVTTPKVITLKDALHEGVNTCLDRKLAHTACFKALDDALGKVTQ